MPGSLAGAMESAVEMGAEAAGSALGAGMRLRQDLRRIRCALLLCLLAVLLLMLPTAYLLVGNLRAPSSCGQVSESRREGCGTPGGSSKCGLLHPEPVPTAATSSSR